MRVLTMNESEIYTRDHLLIQFMLENGYSSIDVEKVYKDWLTWLKMLKIKEARDGRTKEGSEV